jgi:adenylate cyclase class 2
MSHNGQEIEAKFYVSDLHKITTRLHELEARLIQSRQVEINLRFDLPDGSFRSTGRVLRLRQDTQARLTYKGDSHNRQGVLVRQEIEMVVEDFEKGRDFLEALGYQVSMIYEKYRATYELNETLVMLDEMPFGHFVEVEGETLEQIQDVSGQLGLDWSAAIGAGYTSLFENVKKSLKLPFRDLSFENFEGIKVTPGDLDAVVADE